MTMHGAKRTRAAEGATARQSDRGAKDSVASEDLGTFLDRELWPLLRERCAAFLWGRIEAEVSRAREIVDGEYAGRWSQLLAKEAAVEGSLRAAEEARAGFEAERNALVREKDRMAADKHMDDILRLNIGGQKMVSVQRKTLCLVEDSMLASSFSGRWDNSLARDSDGAVFVDFRPELFMPLLDFLRAKRIEDPAMPILMPTVPGHEEAFDMMVRYYGLEGAGRSPPAPLAFTFVPCGEGRTFELRGDGLVATRSTGSHWKRIFGNAIVRRTEIARPVTIQFYIGALGNCLTKDRQVQAGPNFGVAVSSMDRSSDDSNVRKPQGVWTYCSTDGALLAPGEADVVGQNPRAPCTVGDVVTLTLYKDGKMGLAKNGEDQGIIFCNLPDSVKPVVEMNIRYTQVGIVH